MRYFICNSESYYLSPSAQMKVTLSPSTEIKYTLTELHMNSEGKLQNSLNIHDGIPNFINEADIIIAGSGKNRY